MADKKKKPAAVKLEVAEPDTVISISVGTQGTGSVHRVYLTDMTLFEKKWAEATKVVKMLANISPIPTTDLDLDELKAAMEGEEVSLAFQITYKNRKEEFRLSCKEGRSDDGMKKVGNILVDFFDYVEKRAKGLK